MSNVIGEIPAGFFEKFTGIMRVRASGVQDTGHFLWFLKSLSSLRELWLEGSQFSQEFYDRLPAFVHSLYSLTLSLTLDEEDDLQLNFDFIGKLPSLSFLYVVQSLSFESLTSLVGSLGNLGKSDFRFSFK